MQEALRIEYYGVKGTSFWPGCLTPPLVGESEGGQSPHFFFFVIISYGQVLSNMNHRDDDRQLKTLSEYSSKIKRIYLELHGYSFFHGPSEIENVDKRFIGRARLIEKLKNLLTNDETKSGAYLITGYKGMGKSSLVSKVLSEITGVGQNSNTKARYLRILIPLLFLPLLEASIYVTLLMIILFAFTFFLLYKTDLTRPNISADSENQYNNIWRNILNILRANLIISEEEVSRYNIKIAVQDLFLVTLIYNICVPLNYNYANKITHSYMFKLHVYLIFWFLLILTNLLLRKTNDINRKYINDRFVIWRNIKYIFIDVLSPFIKKYINYNHRVCVKINLGHENLREIDILRLIAKSVISTFNDFSKFKLRIPLPDVSSTFFNAVIIYTFLSIFYYNAPLNNINNELKAHSSLLKYFPTLSPYMLVKECNDLVKARLLKIDYKKSLLQNS